MDFGYIESPRPIPGTENLEMQRLTALLSCIVLAVVVAALMSCSQSRPEVVAQVAAPAAITDAVDVAATTLDPVSDETPIDDQLVFSVDDVILQLTTAADSLIEQKLTRTTAQLRPELDRPRFPLALPEPAVTELKTVDLYRRTVESVFLVAGVTRPNQEVAVWQTAFSTAFVVHADGILSTSAHVFDHEEIDDAVVVMDIQGHVYPVLEVVAANRAADTCLFRIGKKDLKPLPLRTAAPPGTAIRVIGHPGDSFYYFSAGHIANFERDELGSLWMNVTADFGQGSSGGPTMDEAGNIVGQVSRTFTLYAGGETSQRSRKRKRTSRQPVETQAMPSDAEVPENKEPADRADPQMVFKACTPAAAIRALTK